MLHLAEVTARRIGTELWPGLVQVRIHHDEMRRALHQLREDQPAVDADSYGRIGSIAIQSDPVQVARQTLDGSTYVVTYEGGSTVRVRRMCRWPSWCHFMCSVLLSFAHDSK